MLLIEHFGKHNVDRWQKRQSTTVCTVSMPTADCKHFDCGIPE